MLLRFLPQHNGTNPIQTPENPTQTQQGPIDLNDLDDLVGTLTHEMRRRNPRIDPSQPELADLIANPSWLRRL